MYKLLSRKQKPDIAIDLGTANTRIMTAAEGIVFDEPTLCCFSGDTGRKKMVAAGLNAVRMRGHDTNGLRVVRPLSYGVLNDIDATRMFLDYAIFASIGKHRPGRLIATIGVPTDATSAERNALMTAAKDAGIYSVTMVDETIAAAQGAGIDIDAPTGAMIIECGAGLTEAVIISLGGLCGRAAIRKGGDSLDQSIIDYLHFKHKFQIGQNMAEQTKLELVEQMIVDAGATGSIHVKGQNMVTGLPETRSILVQELAVLVGKHIDAIADMSANLLGDTAPDLCDDIYSNGIILTGGSAAINLIGQTLKDRMDVPITVAEQSKSCVAYGLHSALVH
ncbi:rod shape-determining protein [uncultured Parasphingorhabdus sp.]|uniref:rod shape-determining protein n=1 Tax=uncultured Parasphingorhabdus sp. TaxID=2709694 RepID=UPI0030D8FF75|tara:strand:- start:6915 stop:7919 length:1005 start_codon:yes stop_codon:yes gene_type:complete